MIDFAVSKVSSVTSTSCCIEWQPIKAPSDDSSIEYELQVVSQVEGTESFRTVKIQSNNNEKGGVVTV